VHAGTALVGSRAMLDEGQSLMVTVTGQYEETAAGRRADWTEGAGLAATGLPTTGLPATGLAGTGLAAGRLAATGLADEGEWTDEVCAASAAGHTGLADRGRGETTLTAAALTGAALAAAGQEARNRAAGPEAAHPGPAAGEADWPGLAARDGDGTLLPFYLDPMTKLFLVALIWCRPWLDDPSATKPLPRTPEIARGALEVTGAYHELERFDANPEYRDLLSARVAEHIKVLRRKIADRGLAAADVRLSDEVAVRILIEHGIITSADLSRLDDPAWRSRQEDLWWTQG